MKSQKLPPLSKWLTIYQVYPVPVKFRIFHSLNQNILFVNSHCVLTGQTIRMLKGAQRMEIALMQIADNAGPDQPAHSRKLIRPFVARFQDR